jgi:hypothetical protein
VTKLGYIKFGWLYVEPQEIPVHLDPVGQDRREIVLEIAQPATKATSLLLGVDSRKGFLSQHLSVDRRARARRGMREQEEPDEAEGWGSQ